MVASVSWETKDAFAYDGVPWDRFPRSPEIRDDMEFLCSDDADVVFQALRGVNGELANSAWPVAALAVPFLLRVAADPRGHRRAYALELAAGIVQWTPGPGRCARDELLYIADGGMRFEPSGWLGTCGFQAARDVVAADIDLVMVLLDDHDPEARRGSRRTGDGRPRGDASS
ncbi:hypothetical protein AB0L85_15495 [Streptomyces sp. NPDC052051]|uniref:hypothetical protein n=1 Tax=Streptomyces sp. NPDC052051 TaxID=3154649 RepID=UPI00344569CF